MAPEGREGRRRKNGWGEEEEDNYASFPSLPHPPPFNHFIPSPPPFIHHCPPVFPPPLTNFSQIHSTIHPYLCRAFHHPTNSSADPIRFTPSPPPSWSE